MIEVGGSQVAVLDAGMHAACTGRVPVTGRSGCVAAQIYSRPRPRVARKPPGLRLGAGRGGVASKRVHGNEEGNDARNDRGNANAPSGRDVAAREAGDLRFTPSGLRWSAVR